MRAWKQVVAGTIAAMAVGAGAQTTASSAVAELALKDGKTHFRSGEPIVLEVTYRPGADGCFLVSDTAPSPMDVVEVTPTEGAFRWMQGNGGGSDASGWTQLKANMPAMVRLTLNDLYRFDERGTYMVKVRTSHLHCGEFGNAKAEELTTNAVSFDVEPFAEADEKALAESLEERIRASKSEREADALAEELEYLPGDDATRAKLSLTLHEKTFLSLRREYGGFSMDCTQPRDGGESARGGDCRSIAGGWRGTHSDASGAKAQQGKAGGILLYWGGDDASGCGHAGGRLHA